jgi:hypothetical protein
MSDHVFRGPQTIDHRVDLVRATVYLRLCVRRDMHVGGEGGGGERVWS